MAKQKEHDVQELQQVLAHTEQELREAVSDRDEKIRTLKQQRRLLKHEVLTLRSQLNEAEVQSAEQIQNSSMSKRKQLRNQLRHQHDLEVSQNKLGGAVNLNK